MKMKVDCGCEKDVFACREHAHPAHTPTPWKVDGFGITSKVFNIATLDTTAKDMDDNQIGIGELSANAAFIVKACNVHEELIETLKNLVAYSVDCHVGGAPVVAEAREVLAKAEGSK